jgi:hypothetical protein
VSVTTDDAADALLVMEDASEWSLTPAQWVYIDLLVTALIAALASDDSDALMEAVTGIELFGPVRSVATQVRGSQVTAPDTVRTRLEAAIGLIKAIQAPVPAESRLVPIAIFISDESIHDQVERAVEALAQSAGLVISSRQPPVIGSWRRRMRAALRSPAGEEILATAMHAADARLVQRTDAETTAIMLQNLGPVIGALQPTKDAVVRVGALLIVKIDWTLVVHQLTARQQLVLDHSPDLEAAPHQILQALGLAAAESAPIGPNTIP